jgi:Thioredoxin domain
MLEIKVLGTGCAGCLMTEQLVIESLQELGIRDASVELVTDERLIEYGLLADRAPGLLINGQLAWAGSVPDRKQVREWLQQLVTPKVAA